MRNRGIKVVFIISPGGATDELVIRGAEVIERPTYWMAETARPAQLFVPEQRRSSFPKPPRVIKPTKTWSGRSPK
jgi:hypothetical protein